MTRIDLQEAGKTAEGTSRTLHASEMRNEISIGLLNAYKNREQYSTKDSIKDFDLVCGVLSIAGRSQILNGGAVTSTDNYVFQLSTLNGHILRNLVNETSLRGFPYPMRPGKELDVWEKGM